MRNLLIGLAIVALATLVAADTSNPQGLPMTSGENDGGGFLNFLVAGEDASGVIGSANYVSGVGLAAMIFSPLLPTPGTYVPVVTRTDNNAISYPNPFRPGHELCNIAYRLTQDREVKVYIMDMSGTVIKTLVTNSSSRASDGYSRIFWDGTTAFGGLVANGVYLVKLVSGGQTIGSTKIIAVR